MGVRKMEESAFSSYFTKDLIDIAAKLWMRSSISLIDVRHKTLFPNQSIDAYRAPSSMLIYTYGEQANITLNKTLHHSEHFGVFHAGKGTQLSIEPIHSSIQSWMIFYKAETAPFYKRDIHRLREKVDPFSQIYGFSLRNPISSINKVQKLYEHWVVGTTEDQLYAKALLYQLVYEIYHEIREGAVRIFEQDYVALAKQYLDEHYAEPISIQTFVEMFPISRSQLSRLFKKREHKSLQEYLNERRLDAAKEHLRQSFATIQEIAAGCGFLDELNLIRMFKKYYQMTPSEYRRKMIMNMPRNDIDNDSQQIYNDDGLGKLVKFKGDDELSMLKKMRGKEILFPAILSLMMLLSACSATTPTNNTEQTGTHAEVNGNQSQTRIVKTDNGEVEIPANPKRIFIADWSIVGNVIPFERNLIGVESYFEQYAEFDKWETSWSEQIEEIKYVDRENLENILAMNPDLIITGIHFDDSVEKYSKIAPTITVDIGNMSLEESLEFFGEIFGMENRADDLIDQYHKQIETAKVRLKDAGLLDKRIGFVQGVEGKEVHVHGNLNPSIIYQELGMPAPKLIEKKVFNTGESKGFAEKISIEVLPDYLADADIIGYTKFEDVESLKKELSKVTLWNDIPAVQEENVLYFDFDSSIIGYDYISKMIALDDFVTQLIELPIAKK